MVQSCVLFHTQERKNQNDENNYNFVNTPSNERIRYDYLRIQIFTNVNIIFKLNTKLLP